jgi:hypothetical protein
MTDYLDLAKRLRAIVREDQQPDLFLLQDVADALEQAHAALAVL